jgi:hypothetical protein
MTPGCRTSNPGSLARRAAGAVPTSGRIGIRSRHMPDTGWQRFTVEVQGAETPPSVSIGRGHFWSEATPLRTACVDSA